MPGGPFFNCYPGPFSNVRCKQAGAQSAPTPSTALSYIGENLTWWLFVFEGKAILATAQTAVEGNEHSDTVAVSREAMPRNSDYFYTPFFP